jgi:hypothetical protein
MASFEEIIAGARLPETGVTLCLRGDLQLEFERLEKDLSEARAADAADDSLAAGGRARPIAEQIEKLRQEMAEHERTFVMRGLSRHAWRKLTDDHPPRKDRTDGKDDEDDVNWDTWPTAVIAACSADPVMSVEQVEQLAEVITDWQWNALFAGCMVVNRMEISVPKSVSASAVLAATAPKSKQPAPGGSAGGGSSGGSLAG